MGQSTDAIIAYGVDYGDDPPWDYERDDDYYLEDEIAKAAGLVRPGGEIDDDTPYIPIEQRPQEEQDALRDYWAQKRALVAEFPFDLEYHCSGNYPMYFLAARGSVLTANRGYPKVIGDHMAQEFPWPVERLAEVGLAEPKQAPDWHLFSYWSY